MASSIAVIGSGMAALGAAYRLRENGVVPTLYEKNTYPGGHTASWKNEQGFVFDEGPHISFTKDKRVQSLLAKSVNNEYEVINAKVNNYWKGHWIKHPAQCNLYGLPSELIVNILREFIETTYSERRDIKTYADWLFASYGETFARTFPMTYGKKYHTVSADRMSTDWLGPRLYKPDIEEILRGAISPSTPDVHYVSDFRYPTRDGFVAYLRLFLENLHIRFDHNVDAINPDAKELRFRNGACVKYDALISSMPLPELLPRIAGVPDDVLEASQKLACTTCVVVNIGLDRDNISDAHWTYFYDDDFIFTRLSFPHMLSPGNVPPGKGSIQAELYYSRKYRPLTVSENSLIDPTLRDLRRCGLLREGDKVVCKEAKVIPYANVIFDLDRDAALNVVHGFLDEVGIKYCGRYGEWGYHWTDQSLMSGERAADEVLDGK